jgi:hypothetical protein
MRVVLIVAMMAVAIGVIYMPLSKKIVEQRRLITTEKKRLDCIRDVETLRRDTTLYTARINTQSDTNEWVKYLLEGCRQSRVRLRDMQSKESKKVGPYTAVFLALEVQGQYPHLKQFLEWLEQSDRLLRIETVRLEKLPDIVTMKIQILGVVGKSA